MRDGVTRPNPYLGAVVRSVAGRDRRRVFIVTDVTLEGGRVMLTVADGSLRRISDGKRKNARHVKIIAAVTDEEWKRIAERPDDEVMRETLAGYDPLIKSADDGTIYRPDRGGTEN